MQEGYAAQTRFGFGIRLAAIVVLATILLPTILLAALILTVVLLAAILLAAITLATVLLATVLLVVAILNVLSLPGPKEDRKNDVAQADPLGVPGVDCNSPYGVRHCRPSRSMSWSAGRGPQVPAA